MVCMRLSTRVFGWRLVTGDVIALCHSDDFMFAKDTVSHVVKKMEETDCNFLYADGIFVYEQNTNKGGEKMDWRQVCSLEGEMWLASIASYLLYQA